MRIKQRIADRWCSRRAHPERGDALVEALVFMGVLLLVATAYIGSAMSAQKVERTTQATDVVTQQGQAVIEAAKAAPWSMLGFYPSQPGFTATGGLSGAPTVKIVSPPPSTTLLTPCQCDGKSTPAIDTSGVHMNVQTDITWLVPAGGSADPGVYGTKLVTVRVTYLPLGRKTALTKTFHLKRTSAPSEAVPGRLRSSLASIPTGAPSCVYVTRGDASTLTWRRIDGASQYRIYRRSVASGVDTLASAIPSDPSVSYNTFTSAPYDDASRWAVRAVLSGGSVLPDCGVIQ